jgi:hypothetical protein
MQHYEYFHICFQYTTQVVADSLDPEFNEDFSFQLDSEGILGKVL